MVEHVDGDDAVGAYLRGDVVGFRHGIGGGQCRRLQYDHAGRRACRVGDAVFDLHGFGRHLPCGDVDALVAHDAGFDAACRVGGHVGHGQHAAHRVDVVGQGFHDRGVVGAEQHHVVGGDGFGGVSGHGLHFDAGQAGRGNGSLRDGVGHIVGAGVGCAEGERQVGGVHGGGCAGWGFHGGQLRRFGRSAMHVLFERNGGACVWRGLLDYRIDHCGQRVGRLH